MVVLSIIMSIFVGIQDPIIQKFAIRIAGGYISQKTGGTVQIGRLYIDPNFTIQIDHFLVKDQKSTDLLKVELLKVRPIMEDIIHGNIHIGRVELTNADANLITYEGEDHLNFQFLLDAFPTDTTKEKSDKVTPIMVDKIMLKNLDFQFWDQNNDDPQKTANHLMDFSHLILTDINLDANNLEIIGDSIRTNIKHLAFADTSGFKLNYLESQVLFHGKGIALNGLKINTIHSDLQLDLLMDYPSLKAFSSFVDSVDLNVNIQPSILQVSDLGPLSESLYQMTDPVKIEGLMKGTVSHFNLDQLKFSFGEYTDFEGSIELRPMNLEKGSQVLNIKRLNYSYDDLANFHLPTASGTIPIPTMLEPLGKGTIKGKFKGSMERFNANLTATSEVGNVGVNIEKHIGEMRSDIYVGEINAEQLNVGVLTNASNTIGSLDLASNVTVRQSKNGDLDLDIDGAISNVMLLGNDINKIILNGNLYNNSFDGKIRVDDDELKLDFKGFFDFSDPSALGGNFNMDIFAADLHKLNIIKDDRTALLKASITANMNHINNFNEAEGTLSIKNLSFTNSTGNFPMKQFDASISNDRLLAKRINLDCDYLDFEMAGKMDFTTIATAFKQYVYSYVTIPQWTEELALFEKSGESSDQDFRVKMNIKDPKPIMNMVMPDLTIAKNTNLEGSFNSTERNLDLTLRSKYIRFNSIKINGIECKNSCFDNKSRLSLGVDQIILRDSTPDNPTILGLDQFAITAILQNDSVKTQFAWDDESLDDHNRAIINTSFLPSLTGGRASFNYAEILLNDSLWTIDPNNFIEIDNDNIQISNLSLKNDRQSLKIDGVVPMTNNDTLSVALDGFDLSTFNFVLGIDLNGTITGDAMVNGLKEDLTVFADLCIDQLGLDNQTYGDAEISSKWDQEHKAIDLDFGLINEEKKVVSLIGSYFTEREDDNLDFKLNIDDLNLAMLSPFLSSFAQRVQGLCQGDINVNGSLNQPGIEGTIKINDGGCKVNFLNTFYTFSPTIKLTNEAINISDMVLTDTLGNSAIVVGSIQHDHLKDMYLDISLYPRDFLAMATTANLSPSFYGTAIASGIVTAKGPTNNLQLLVKATTKKGTSMTIPIGGSSSVEKHEFITFVHHEPEPVIEDEDFIVEAQPKPEKEEPSNLDIGLTLNVNKDAQVKIALPNGLGSMEANGDGIIHVGMQTTTDVFTLNGDYIINSGNLSLNIQNVLKRNFSIDPGSSIAWTGDPVDGDINVTGVYQTKAAISSLGLIDSTSMGTSNVKVECLVHVKKKLMNPDISFGLRLPNASEDLQQAVFYVIDTTNQSELLMQVVSLLLFNSFNYGSGGISGAGLLTSQVNDFISQFTHDIDININYKPGDDLSNEEMTVDLKKQLFNDRLTIETNFGVIIPTSTYASSSTNIIGDVNIDYKITKDGRLSAQAFNRSNYNTMYYQYTYYKMVPYTQGIGVSYNRSFDTFKDLFKRRTNNMNLPNGPMISRPTGNKNPSNNVPK